MLFLLTVPLPKYEGPIRYLHWKCETEYKAYLRLEGISGDQLQQAAVSHQVLCTSEERDSTVVQGCLFQHSVTLIQWKSSIFKWNSWFFSFCLVFQLSPVLPLHTTKKKAWCHPHSSLTDIYTHYWNPPSLPFSVIKPPALSDSPGTADTAITSNC